MMNSKDSVAPTKKTRSELAVIALTYPNLSDACKGSLARMAMGFPEEGLLYIPYLKPHEITLLFKVREELELPPIDWFS